MIHIVMSIVLLISTTGFTVSKHYCGNELVNFSIDAQAKSCCDMSGGCCHTESEHFQVKENFLGQVISKDFQDYGLDFLFVISFTIVNIQSFEIDNQIFELADSPPPPKIQTNLSLLQIYLC